MLKPYELKLQGIKEEILKIGGNTDKNIRPKLINIT